MLTRIILFLIRRKLGVKLGETFQFVEQKSTKDHYYFSQGGIFKWEWHDESETFALKPSNVRFNWIVDPKCKVRKYID